MSEAQRFWNEFSEWSQATFGCDTERGPIGPLKHLQKEAAEASEEIDPARRRVEIADCLFLTFDAARRDGMTLDSLIETAFRKLEKNKLRTFPKPIGDAISEHVRGVHD